MLVILFWITEVRAVLFFAPITFRYTVCFEKNQSIDLCMMHKLYLIKFKLVCIDRLRLRVNRRFNVVISLQQRNIKCLWAVPFNMSPFSPDTVLLALVILHCTTFHITKGYRRKSLISSIILCRKVSSGGKWWNSKHYKLLIWPE